MKIKIEINFNGWLREDKKDKFRADWTDLPGSPQCGFGETKEEAVADLFRRLLYPSPTHSYLDVMQRKELLQSVEIYTR